LEFASYVSKLKGEPEEKGPFVSETENLLKDKNFEQVFQSFASSTSILLEAPEKGISKQKTLPNFEDFIILYINQ